MGTCHLPPTLPPATSMQRCLLCHPSAPATFPFWVPLAMAATFVRPCHLPPPYNVTTHPTVSQWVASLPLVRACHLSFSRLLATFPQLCHLATSMQRSMPPVRACHLSISGATCDGYLPPSSDLATCLLHTTLPPISLGVIVRACHLSFPYQDLRDDSTTLPPSTSMQRCHPSRCFSVSGMVARLATHPHMALLDG